MKTASFSLGVLIAAIAAGWISLALAGEGRCAHCGCSAACRKVCRLVKEEKKIEIVCWGSKREDFCLPAKNHICQEHCETVCDDPAICNQPKRFSWYEWLPGCATMHTRTKLMKKTITKIVPSFKYVVEDLCDQCCAKCGGEVVQQP